MIDEQAEAEFIEVEAAWVSYTIAAAFIIAMLSIYKLVTADYKREISEYLQRLMARIAANYSPRQQRARSLQTTGPCVQSAMTSRQCDRRS